MCVRVAMDCSLCCEAFTEEGAHVPRNLDCGHTFCTACIEKLEAHAPLRQGPRCPDCRQPVRFNRRTSRTLPKNYKLLELLRERRSSHDVHHHRHPHSHHHHQPQERKPQSAEANASCLPSSHEMYPAAPPGMGSEDRQSSHGMMFMGTCYPPPVYPPYDEWMQMGMGVGMHRRARTQLTSLPEDLRAFRIAVSASETESRNQTPSAFVPAQTTETVSPAAVSDAVENGRAVAGPNGTLVCKFFQGGTCRYGHNCWFSHPVQNENKTMCRHWLKGQCRMGLSCNFKHGTQRCVPPMRPQRRRPQRDPAAPGPSGERPLQSEQQSRPSVVVFVSSCGSTVHRATGPLILSNRQQWGNPPPQAGSAGRSFVADLNNSNSSGSSNSNERFFDEFHSSYQT